MSDVRKGKDRVQTHKQDTAPSHSEIDPNQEQHPGETKLNAWSILGRAIVMAGAVFAAGLILTITLSILYKFDTLPMRGDTLASVDKTQHFEPYYPKLRPFAIVTDPSQRGDESQFSRIGAIGTGFFIYTIVNTFHWVMELGVESLGNMILIPIVVLCVGSAIFFYKMIPRSLQKPSMALSVGIGLSILHSCILLVFFVMIFLLSSLFPNAFPSMTTFSSLFQRPYFYSGDVMMSTTRAGVLILLLTGYTYGAISGGILYAWVSFHDILSRREIH